MSKHSRQVKDSVVTLSSPLGIGCDRLALLYYLGCNAAFVLIALAGSSDIPLLQRLAPFAYGALGALVLVAVFIRREVTFLHLLIPFVVWDAAIANCLPVLTRAFTPSLALLMSLFWWVAQKHRIEHFPLFAIALALAGFVSLGHFVVMPDSNESLYILLQWSAALLALVVFNERPDQSQTAFMGALVVLGISTACFACADIFHAVEHGLISEEVFATGRERLGTFGATGNNTVGFLFGLGALAALLAIPQLTGYNKRVIVVAASIGICALLMTKSLSQVIPFFLIVLFILFSGRLNSSSIGLRQRLAIPALALSVAAMCVAVLLFTSTNALSFLDTGRDYSTLTGRTTLWLLSLETIQQSPLFGWPYGAVRAAFPWKVQDEGGEMVQVFVTPHNFVLDFALYVGIPLALAILYSFLHTVYACRGGLRLNSRGAPVPVWSLPLFGLISLMAIDVWYLMSYLPMVLALMALRAKRALGGSPVRVKAPFRIQAHRSRI